MKIGDRIPTIENVPSPWIVVEVTPESVTVQNENTSQLSTV